MESIRCKNCEEGWDNTQKEYICAKCQRLIINNIAKIKVDDLREKLFLALIKYLEESYKPKGE